jgi:hypothetical protein
MRPHVSNIGQISLAPGATMVLDACRSRSSAATVRSPSLPENGNRAGTVAHTTPAAVTLPSAFCHRNLPVGIIYTLRIEDSLAITAETAELSGCSNDGMKAAYGQLSMPCLWEGDTGSIRSSSQL